MKNKECNNVSGLPVFKVVYVEDDNTGVEEINFTDNPVHGKYFIYFTNDENTEENE